MLSAPQDSKLWFQYLLALFKSSDALYKKMIANLPSKLVIITGMSGVGKSTLSNYVSDEEESVIHIDVDQIVCRVFEAIVPEWLALSDNDQKLFREMLNQLRSHLLFFIYFSQGKDVFYQRYITAEMIPLLNMLKGKILEDKLFSKEFYRQVTVQLRELIKANMLNGKIVLLDIVSSGEGLYPFAEFNPCTVIVYDDILSISNNMRSRNRQSIEGVDPSQYRQASKICTQWQMFFQRKDVQQKHYPTFMDIDYNTYISQLQFDLNLENNQGFIADEEKVLLEARQGLFTSELNQLTLRQPVQFTLNMSEDKEIVGKKLRQMIYAQRGIPQTYFPIPPSLMIMDGMSMSGKTTIACAIQKINQNTKILYRSERQRKILLSKLPDSLHIALSDPFILAHARNRESKAYRDAFPKINFYDTKLLIEVDQFCRKFQEYIFKEEEQQAASKALSFINNGSSMILDNMVFKDNISAFKELEPITILVYCPLNKILEHIKSRMNYAVKTNNPNYWRDPFRVIETFTVFYGAENKHNSPVIEVIHKEDVILVLENLCMTFEPQVFGYNKEQFREKIMSKLDFVNHESINLYPQLNQPGIILNTELSAVENAMKVINLLNYPVKSCQSKI